VLCHIEAVNVYSENPAESVRLYQGLGLKLLWTTVEERGAGFTVYKFGMRFPGGGPELVLHNNPQEQFLYPTVAVEDTRQACEQLSRDPGFLWFEPPHPSQRGYEALVRTPDGNILSLLSPHSEGGKARVAEGAVRPKPSSSPKEIQL
jgi:predicted enzyme related to lactoylglutathione lyase